MLGDKKLIKSLNTKELNKMIKKSEAGEFKNALWAEKHRREKKAKRIN
jgi:hypothetical protein